MIAAGWPELYCRLSVAAILRAYSIYGTVAHVEW